jgi:hypothetical protein
MLVGQARGMSAQKVATGLGLAALATLLSGVGLPALLPPDRVPAIEITEPAAHQLEQGQNETAPPNAGTVPKPASGDDDDDDADDRPARPPAAGDGARPDDDDAPAATGGDDDAAESESDDGDDEADDDD